MSFILKDFEEIEDFDKGLSETLTLKLKDKNIIIFSTLNGINLYAIYDPIKTSFGPLIDKFFQNYNCTYFNRNDLALYSTQFKKTLCDINPKTIMSDIGFNKITRINLISAEKARMDADII